MSPELETLDELLGGDLPIAVIRGLYEEEGRFISAIESMLASAELRLLNDESFDIPRWQWREVLASATSAGKCDYRLSITENGFRRIR